MPNPSTSASSISYRCVCGNDVEIHVTDGGMCPQCGRDISPEMLRSNVSQTIIMPDTPSGMMMSNQARRDDTMEDLTGETLGHFRIVQPLGHGGMGSVYQALDESLQRYVALKVIRGVTQSSPEFDQLMQEARAQARVNHPNVIHIYYVSRDEERPFLAMEFVNGPSLADRIRETKLPYAEVVRIAIETVQALRQSARFDIVHGDIKPANIMLEDGKQVKLSDFGLARRISQSADGRQGISGTPAYMAPEVTRGSEPNVLSDQYSLGVMLFQVTFGRLPYSVSKDSVSAMLEAHQQVPVEFPKPWPKELPGEWRDVLTKLLAKDPADRFKDHHALLRALKNAKPLNLPKAGLLVRGMAWTLDLLIALALFGMLLLPFQIPFVQRLLQRIPLLNVLISGVVLLAPIAITVFQMRWKNSPAKKLFQICIVEEHGLRPGPYVLGARAVFQLTVVWAACLFWIIERFGGDADRLAAGFSTIYTLFLLVSTGVFVFSKSKRSLHDRLFGTRVCLDAGSTEVVQVNA